ncbi:MAG: hypothetical protein H6707_06070 [Deltaproteobacteria bacterium]|nr:hypothetical protein [Deltaproteobacteria bacterium]
MTRRVWLVVALTLAILPSCWSRTARDTRQRAIDEGVGARQHESAPRRTAAARPLPWVEEKGVHDADRTGLEAYRAERMSEENSSALQRQRCMVLRRHYACPLLAHRWTVQALKGRLRLSVEASRAAADRLRERLICHERYGRLERQDPDCLQRLGPRRIVGGYGQGRIWIELTPTGALDQLRQQVDALIEAAGQPVGD